MSNEYERASLLSGRRHLFNGWFLVMLLLLSCGACLFWLASRTGSIDFGDEIRPGDFCQCGISDAHGRFSLDTLADVQQALSDLQFGLKSAGGMSRENCLALAYDSAGHVLDMGDSKNELREDWILFVWDERTERKGKMNVKCMSLSKGRVPTLLDYDSSASGTPNPKWIGREGERDAHWRELSH